MSTRVVDLIDDWEQQSFADGYAGLQRLAEAGFSGVVRAGAAELFMTNGAAVGVEGGAIGDFEGASGTAYRAPSPALPLLAVMQQRSDEVRAKYYTEETAISEVDRTLSGGGFTGYVELSENVLSGDYYLVYHGGESMSVAFVGANGRLIDGDEAFETADDEVGIYEVRPVEVDALDIPDPEPEPEPEPEPAAAAGSGDDPDGGTRDPEPGATGPGATAAEDPDGADATGTDGASGGSSALTEEAEPAGTDQAAGAATAAETETDGPAAGGTGTADRPDSAADPGPDAAPGRAPTADPDGGETATAPGSEPEPTPDPAAGGPSPEEATAAGATDATEPPGTSGAAGEGGDVALETRSIPSLDPNRTTGRTEEEHEREREREATSVGQPAAGAADAGGASGSEPAGTSRSEPAGTAGEAGRDAAALRERLADREAEIERLEADLEEATGRADRLEADLAEVREERDELRAEVERLESELDRLEAESGSTVSAEQRLGAAEALEGTDLFVRYHSKSDATLADAHDGSASREAVVDNLRLEKHTQFDAASAAVGGQPYEAFLEDRLEFGFVRWVVEELLFEIRDTGHTEALADLYEALPDVDRAELDGTIAVRYTEDGQEQRGQESFDVVLRDRMGNPLLVANLNDSREAATQGMMEGLITAGERVGASKETFVGAFLVTESFFEPEALETASEATKSGILSRDKRRSFVNLSRKRGFHLCLVEARNQNFHLAVPEL